MRKDKMIENLKNLFVTNVDRYWYILKTSDDKEDINLIKGEVLGLIDSLYVVGLISLECKCFLEQFVKMESPTALQDIDYNKIWSENLEK